MKRPARLLLAAAVLTLTAATASAMSFTHYSSSEKGGFGVKSAAKTAAESEPVPRFTLDIADGIRTVTFKSWGTCFNELGWDALQVLPDRCPGSSRTP